MAASQKLVPQHYTKIHQHGEEDFFPFKLLTKTPQNIQSPSEQEWKYKWKLERRTEECKGKVKTKPGTVRAH